MINKKIFWLAVVLFIQIFYTIKRYLYLKQRIEKASASYVNINREKQNLTRDKVSQTILSKATHYLAGFYIFSPEANKEFSKRLVNAGWLSKQALVIFLSLQIMIISLAVLSGIIIVITVPWFEAKSFFVKGVTVVLFTWAAYRLPNFYLWRATKRYRQKLKRSFLDFLDLFLICVEAGFSNDKALARVSKELKRLHPELMEQVGLLITELTILPQRKIAWENFAERTGIEETKVIAQIINQSEQLGSSISQALRVQSDMFRSEKLSYVEQKAMRLPTLLTIPLVVFIIPALMILLLGPSILSAIEAFRKLS